MLMQFKNLFLKKDKKDKKDKNYKEDNEFTIIGISLANKKKWEEREKQKTEDRKPLI
jgi:hypothetical protein